MKLDCQVQLSACDRNAVVPVRIEQPSADSIAIVAAAEADASHNLIFLFGFPFLTHRVQEDRVVSGELQRFRFWEFAESLALLHAVRPGATVVDAGANLGYYSALFARTLGPTGMVVAFEPEPRNFQVLQANVLLVREFFPHATPILLAPLALGDREGTANLGIFRDNFGMHSLIHRTADCVGEFAVETVTLDAWRCSPQGRLLEKVDLIKADIQGAELSMLEGAAKTLAKDRPLLCLEFEPIWSGVAACERLVGWLVEHRYDRFRLFHANALEHWQVLNESVHLLNAADVLHLSRRDFVGPYGSLLAYPSPLP